MTWKEDIFRGGYHGGLLDRALFCPVVVVLRLGHMKDEWDRIHMEDNKYFGGLL